ncbi:MAG TPA: PKD domain-containing protein, partial [Flavobacteriales bacterium]|nr:PKD domain-containing protein [Flavobacteriales bacterium]
MFIFIEKFIAMKKIVFLISLICLGALPLSAQIILNNDTTVCSMQIINLNALSSDVSSMQADDSHDSIRDIGFTFNFYGQSYTQLVISGNGYITFDLTQANQYSPWIINAAIPNPGILPENAIMAPWQDINTGIGGSVYYGTTGIAPNRVFVVTWCAVPMFSCTSDLHTSQVVLYEGSNKIEMFIQDKPLCIAWNGGAAVQGLVDATSTNADIVDDPVLLLPRNWPLPWTATNEGWEFIPNGTTSYTINTIAYLPIIAGAVIWTDDMGNSLGIGSSINVMPVVTTTYFAAIQSQCSGTVVDSVTITIGSINNSYDTIYTEVMVFNPVDTGFFYTQSQTINGCDTAFTDSIIHQRLGVQINYNINNPGTATFAINGMVQAMPYSQNYWAGETISIVANVQPNWLFSKWRTYSNSVLPNANSITATFVANASDSCVLVTDFLKAFISGNDTICDNINKSAEVKIYFSGATPPFTFVYAINGVSQPSITTIINPYVLYTKEEGVYTLTSFANGLGLISGSALVTIYQAPTALFTTATDTLSILSPSVQLNDVSTGNIVSWQWDFGDNTIQDFTSSPYHTYKDSLGIYQISLIIMDDNGCSDTTLKQLWISDEYWMYIPNSFTPDLDGVNDVFCLTHHGVREETF